MLKTLPSLRFNNPWAKAIWNKEHISQVIISMKETIGTHGRGGYFDHYGAIRDVIQNHLLQVMSLVAMEEPAKDSGVEGLRDAKCQVLACTRIPSREDCVVGQYDGYTEDATVPNGSCTPTFAVVRLFVDNERWRGVPFILLTGKALDEKNAQVQIMFHGSGRNGARSGDLKDELILNIQPENQISLTTNVKEKGYNEGISRERMVLHRNEDTSSNHQMKGDDAYSKLIYDALKGNSSSFVRDDELRLSWEIFSPLLHQIENVNPFPYTFGSQGPPQAQRLLLLEDCGICPNQTKIRLSKL